MNISIFDSESFCGYTQKTTFWMDFSIAEAFGEKAIKDTFNRAFEEWKGNYIYLTELVRIMNWKCWQWNEKNEDWSDIYLGFYEKAKNYALKHLKGEELSYYFRTTD